MELTREQIERDREWLKNNTPPTLWHAVDRQCDRSLRTHDAEAECERLRDFPDVMRDGVSHLRKGTHSSLSNEDAIRIAATEHWADELEHRLRTSVSATPPPEGEPCDTCGGARKIAVDTPCPDCQGRGRKDAPHTPQAHGDALADYRDIEDYADYGRQLFCSKVEFDRKCANVRQALTASGVLYAVPEDETGPDGEQLYSLHKYPPHGADFVTVRPPQSDSGVPKGGYHEGFEEGMRAGHGVPYIPEEVKRLPEDWMQQAGQARRCLNDGKSAVYESCARQLEKALASAPAVERVPVEVAKRVIAARDAMISGDVQEVWYQLYRIADPDCTQSKPWAELERIAAAPQRGGE